MTFTKALREVFTLSLLVASLPNLGPLVSTCCGDDSLADSKSSFRVATDVFFGNEKAPAQQTLTLFSAGVAYDISLNDRNQITMVDVARDRIVLLNKADQTQTSIDLRELQTYFQSARKQAETSELANYLSGSDKVEVLNDTVTVGDKVLRYKATLQQPREPGMSAEYAKAADALMLLNGWRSGVPPFSRLNLNRVVAEQKCLPEEITRTSSSDSKTEIVRCRLFPNWRLSKDDELQVSEIGKMLVTFRSVSQSEFFGKTDKIADK